MRHLFILLVFLSVGVFPQTQELSINDFQVSINEGNLLVFDESGNNIMQMNFINPVHYLTDLDGDSSDELLIIDSTNNSGIVEYRLFIFNTIEPFHLVDSINSGSVEPYYTTPEELGGVILVTGNSSFSFLDKENEGFLPLNCWKFEAGELYQVNDEIYDLFIAENDALVTLIDDYFHSNINNCSASEKMKPAITAAYVNYINAGEQSLASQFLKNYYLCADLEEFRNQIDELISN